MPKAALYSTIFVFTFLMGLSTIVGSLQEPKKIIITTPLEQELAYWKSIVRKHPTFTDGYVEIAKLQMALDKFDEAQETLLTAHSLSPNSKKVNNTVRVLGTRSF